MKRWGICEKIDVFNDPVRIKMLLLLNKRPSGIAVLKEQMDGVLEEDISNQLVFLRDKGFVLEESNNGNSVYAITEDAKQAAAEVSSLLHIFSDVGHFFIITAFSTDEKTQIINGS